MTEAPSKTVRNERIKLHAAALNGVAVASAVAGFVTPLIALSYGVGASATRGTALAAVAWLALALFLHYLAWRVLGGLQE